MNMPAPAPAVASLPVMPVGAGVLEVPGKDIREKLQLLEAALAGSGQTLELPVQHHFARGVYCRELLIPQGIVLVGKIHKFSQINIVLKGDISVLTETGVKRLKGGDRFVSPAGIKRAGYAHADTVWLTIHGSHETDLDLLEAELIAASFEEFDALIGAAQQGGGSTCVLGQS